MAAKWIELVTGSLEAKRRWRRYKARVRQLPPTYGTAVDGIQRYLLHVGPTPADGNSAASMFEDLADLFEQAAADGTSVRAVVGNDPVEFVEVFAQNYWKGGYVARERNRLISTIQRAEEGDGGSHP